MKQSAFLFFCCLVILMSCSPEQRINNIGPGGNDTIDTPPVETLDQDMPDTIARHLPIN